MSSRLVSTASAVLLFAGGTLLLFVPEALVGTLIADYPAGAAWLAQLVAAGWLGLGALNWLNRSTVLGGIYGRPVVLANMALHFISAMVLVDAALESAAARALWLVAAPFAIFAIIYGMLLARGPFDRRNGT